MSDKPFIPGGFPSPKGDKLERHLGYLLPLIEMSRPVSAPDLAWLAGDYAVFTHSFSLGQSDRPILCRRFTISAEHDALWLKSSRRARYQFYGRLIVLGERICCLCVERNRNNEIMMFFLFVPHHAIVEHIYGCQFALSGSSSRAVFARPTVLRKITEADATGWDERDEALLRADDLDPDILRFLTNDGGRPIPERSGMIQTTDGQGSQLIFRRLDVVPPTY